MKKLLFSFILISLLISGCSKDGDLNFFTVSQDIDFGEQLDSTIQADTATYPILDQSTPENIAAYEYLNSIMYAVLESEEILYYNNDNASKNFPWEVTIINEDVKNAFAAPGGKLYFYTGLISYLDSASHLAGIMAHEIAHSDRRHSTERLTKQYSLSTLLSILIGDNESTLVAIASQMALGATTLTFSRKDEHEADSYSVYYLSDTKYHPTGIAGFFEKLKREEYIDENGDNSENKSFTFLSTHPSDADRLENIDNTWDEIGNPTGIYSEQAYNEFKNNLGL